MPSTTMTTGHALRRARELADMSERAAARSLGVRRSTLRDWEADQAAPDADRLAAAVRLYSVDLETIWPDRRPLISADEPDVLRVGAERVPVETDPVIDPDGVRRIDNRVVLTRYLAAVRRQRGLGPTERVDLRADDIASLANVLDLDDTALETELAELLDLTPAGARWTMRALVVGGLMAIGATSAIGSTWFSPATAAPLETATPVTHVVESAVTEALEFATPTTEVSEQALVQTPGTVETPSTELAPPTTQTPSSDVATPVADPASPFSTEPSSIAVELAPAVFAVAPATEWSPVDTSPFSTTPNDQADVGSQAALPAPPAELPAPPSDA
ncbi:MAG: helix-turn-helix domain-containing protein [Microthrixaceae bacterium]